MQGTDVFLSLRCINKMNKWIENIDKNNWTERVQKSIISIADL